MKKFTDLHITGITWNQRSIQISWHSANADMEAESCLYQHSNGTWSVDPFTRSLGSSFGEKLLTELMKTFVSQAFSYDDASSFNGGEVARVEGILKKDAMFSRSLKKAPVVSEQKAQRSRISVWFAD